MKNWKHDSFAVFIVTLAIAVLIFVACENLTDPAHVHQWGAWTRTTAPTCSTKGVEIRICSLDSSHTDTRFISENADAHNWGVWTQTTAPTETIDGEEARTCTLNAAHKDTRTIAALSHTHIWGEWEITKAPTETEDGEETRTCTLNAAHKETYSVAALNHTHIWGDWSQTTAPTCTTAGEDTRICTVNTAHIDTRAVAINPNAHDYRWVVTTAASFIEEGVDKELCSHNSSHTRGTRTTDPLPITTTQEWNSACYLIGPSGSYTLTIGGDFAVVGSTTNTFPMDYSGLTVTLKGSGKLYLIGQGNMIRLTISQILIIDSADLTLEGLTKGQNGATQDNNTSVIYVGYGALELRDGTIKGNTSHIGGGVYLDMGTFTMTGGTISGNTSRIGGGVCVERGTFTMTGGTISGNTATDPDGNPTFGGGVYLDMGTFTMKGGKISGNTVSSSRNYANGGGVYVGESEVNYFIMEGGEISGNTASSGGGVFSSSQATFTMNGGEIVDNTAFNGGGVYASIITMNGTAKISGNTALSRSYSYSPGEGGGENATNFTMNSGEITDNIAFYGGGVYAKIITMNGGTISGNTAAPIAFNYKGSNGGGVYMRESFAMSGGTISGNTVIDGFGGGVGTVTNGGGFLARFTKTGGIIYGYSESDTVNNNTVKDSSGTVLNDRGHAIRIAHLVDSYIRRKETTSQHEDNLSCIWHEVTSMIEGEWDQ
jgi:hypothetical protein